MAAAAAAVGLGCHRHLFTARDVPQKPFLRAMHTTQRLPPSGPTSTSTSAAALSLASAAAAAGRAVVVVRVVAARAATGVVFLRRRAASSTRRDALMAVGGERLTDLLFVLATASPSSSSSFASERLGELGGDGEREQGGDERSGSRATDGDTGVSTGDRSARVGAEECSRRGPSSSSGS